MHYITIHSFSILFHFLLFIYRAIVPIHTAVRHCWPLISVDYLPSTLNQCVNVLERFIVYVSFYFIKI